MLRTLLVFCGLGPLIGYLSLIFLEGPVLRSFNGFINGLIVAYMFICIPALLAGVWYSLWLSYQTKSLDWIHRAVIGSLISCLATFAFFFIFGGLQSILQGKDLSFFWKLCFFGYFAGGICASLVGQPHLSND